MKIKDIKDEKIRDLAILRTREHSKYNRDLSEDAILDLNLWSESFSWRNTDEGYNFWENVCLNKNTDINVDKIELASILKDIDTLRDKVIKLMNL